MMSNENDPGEQNEDTQPLNDNPFGNDEFQPEGRDVESEHATDDPGRKYGEAETAGIDEPGIDDDRERHPSSEKSSPSSPRRPGSGTGQAPSQGHDASVTSADRVIPGEIFLKDEQVEINAGLAVTSLRVANTSDRPIQIGPHFHFAEVNPGLEFDRAGV